MNKLFNFVMALIRALVNDGEVLVRVEDDPSFYADIKNDAGYTCIYRDDSFCLALQCKPAGKLLHVIMMREFTTKEKEELGLALDGVDRGYLFEEITAPGETFSGHLLSVLPEFEPCLACEQRNPYHMYNVSRHIWETVRHASELGKLSGMAHTDFCMAALLHDIGKPMCRTWDEKKAIDRFFNHAKISAEAAVPILSRFHIGGSRRRDILYLIEKHDYQIEMNGRGLKDKPFEERCEYLISNYDKELLADLLLLGICDSLAQNPEMAAANVRTGLEYLREADRAAYSYTVRYIQGLNSQFDCRGRWDKALEGTEEME